MEFDGVVRLRKNCPAFRGEKDTKDWKAIRGTYIMSFDEIGERKPCCSEMIVKNHTCLHKGASDASCPNQSLNNKGECWWDRSETGRESVDGIIPTNE